METAVAIPDGSRHRILGSGDGKQVFPWNNDGGKVWRRFRSIPEWKRTLVRKTGMRHVDRLVDPPEPVKDLLDLCDVPPDLDDDERVRCGV